jgi:OOP family OmpA-OmpF porin
VGANFLQEVNVSPAARNLQTRAQYGFDPGFAGHVGLGYGLGNGIRLEAEGAYSWNDTGSINVPRGFTANSTKGHIQQYGGFANVYYDFNLNALFNMNTALTPYLGAGLGYEESEVRVGTFGTGCCVVKTPNRSQGTFAYQLIAGVAYPLTSVAPGLALTAEYRFIGSESLNGSQLVTINGNTTNVSARFAERLNHQLLLGVRYAFGAPPPPPPPMTASVPAPAPSLARSYLVFFDWDRADLTERARQIIAGAADASKKVQVTRIEVNGHADRTGTPQYNQALSIRRANAVSAELVRDGVPADAITVKGFGDTVPLVPTAAGVREPQNRRVEIVLM